MCVCVCDWRVSVTPPDFLIYAVYHITMGILYVGQTHMAPIQRLRKHMTDAAASVDGSSLHHFTCTCRELTRRGGA